MQERNRILRPMMLASILGIGFALFWAIAVAWIGGTVQPAVGPYERIQIRHDGTPVITTTSRTHGTWTATYRTLAGEPVQITEVDPWMRAAALQGSELPRNLWWPSDWNRRMAAYTLPGSPNMIWYLVYSGEENATAHFEGYDLRTRQRIGFIGTKGFRDDNLPRSERFPTNERKTPLYMSPYPASLYAQSKIHLLAAPQLFEIDLSQRTVDVLTVADDTLSTTTLTRPARSGDGSASLTITRSSLLIRTPDRIEIRDRWDDRRRPFLLPDDLRKPTLTVYELDGDQLILHESQSNLEDDGSVQRLTWINSEGEILRREELAFPGRTTTSPVFTALGAAAAFPSPTAITIGILVVAPMTYMATGEEPDYASAVSRALSDFSPALIITLLLSSGLAYWCFRRHSQYALPHYAAWTIFVFLLGWPALVGYLLHRRWPVRENCPDCGNTVPRDRDDCASCGQEFAAPALKGTEVFA